MARVTTRLVVVAAVMVGCHFDRSGLSAGVPSDHGPADAAHAEGSPVDGGCPAGQLLCHGKCVDPRTSLEHCGGCDQPCAPQTADRCQAGVCICGSGAGPCTSGLSCVSGSCSCVSGPGSACNGCCLNNVCHPVGGAQDAARCGQGGETCKSCDDLQPCTADSCLPAGACQSAFVPDGTLCDDGQFCSENDSCKQGQCLGRPKDCKDSNPCTVDTCDEALDKCVSSPAPNGTKCGKNDVCIDGKCVKNGGPPGPPGP